MSGPKSGSWRLVPGGSGGGGVFSFSDVQRFLQRHQEKIDALQRRLAELRGGVKPAVLDGALDTATVLDNAWGEKAVRELNHRYAVYAALRDSVERAEAEAAEAKAQEDVRRRLEAEKARIAAEEARLAAERAARVQSTVALAAHLAGKRAERKAAEARAEADTRSALGRRAIDDAARLLPGVPDEVRRQVEALAIACLAEASTERCLLMANDLKVRVDSANRAQKAELKRVSDKRKADAEEAKEALRRLAELGAPARGALNASLYDVVDGERAFDDNFRAEAVSAIKAAEQARATEILKDALTELGYVVGEEFETAFAASGNTFQKPEWGDYHCQLTMDMDRQRASVFMVRTEGEAVTLIDEAKERDREMEVAWCSELPALLDRLREKNFVMDLHRRMEPGTVPVPVVKRRPAAKKQRQSAAAGTVAQIERQVVKP